MPATLLHKALHWAELCNSEIEGLHISPDGRLLAVAGLQGLIIIDIVDGNTTHLIEFGSNVTAVCVLWVSPQDLVVSCSSAIIYFLNVLPAKIILSTWLPRQLSDVAYRLLRAGLPSGEVWLVVCIRNRLEIWEQAENGVWSDHPVFNFQSDQPNDLVENVYDLGRLFLVSFAKGGLLIWSPSDGAMAKVTGLTTTIVLQSDFLAVENLLILVDDSSVSLYHLLRDAKLPRCHLIASSPRLTNTDVKFGVVDEEYVIFLSRGFDYLAYVRPAEFARGVVPIQGSAVETPGAVIGHVVTHALSGVVVVISKALGDSSMQADIWRSKGPRSETRIVRGLDMHPRRTALPAMLLKAVEKRSVAHKRRASWLHALVVLFGCTIAYLILRRPARPISTDLVISIEDLVLAPEY